MKKIEGERKLVTVLFTDIVGSTALAERLDPEDWGEIVSGAHEQVSAAVYRYAGTIAQLLGDGVMAFFGAPVTHEDDPVRAVNAAFDILDAIKAYAAELSRRTPVREFHVRVGLNTGLVVAGSIGSDRHMEYLAVGDTVNLAARLQSAAEPDTILVSGNTARQVKHAFDLESRGLLELKGKSEPVSAFRVVARKAVPALARGIEGLTSPLVGRDREVKRLQDCIAELRNPGHGQIVSVMGEAGLGKSRLVAEIRRWTMDVADWKLDSNLQVGHPDVAWHEGRSLSFDVNTPYAPFISLLNNLFDLHPDDTSARKYFKVRNVLKQIAPGQITEIAPFIAALLNVELEGEDADRVKYLEPPMLRGRVFAAVIQLVQALAAAQPVILVFEDLHWADSVSLDLLEQLMPLTGQLPLMLLALFRPQQLEPSYRFHEVAAHTHADRYTQILLEPLDDANSRQLVANLLEIEDLPASVCALILRKAEGNPFFVEEVIRSLLDAQLVVRVDEHWRATREIENIALPDTLAGVIAARLDRLDDETKRIAQTAAVIGREFQREILAELVPARETLDTALLDLERRELVREKGPVPELIYLFKHALTQETAYATVLLSKRRELHVRIAECLERTDPTRVNEIARHFLEGQAEARALPYLVEAGLRASRAYAAADARMYLTRALEILKVTDDPSQARRIYEGLGDLYMLVNDIPRAAENYRAMRDYSLAHGDVPMQVSALNKLSRAVMFMGQFEETEQALGQAEQLAREYSDRIGLAEMFWMRCGICTMTADFGNAEKYLGESVAIGRELDLKEQMSFGLTHLANTLVFMTRFDEGFARAQEALAIAEEIGNRQRQAELLAFPVPMYYMHVGDLDTALAQAQRGLNIAVQIGAVYPESIAAYVLGLLYQMRGDYASAVRYFEQGVRAGRMSGLAFLELVPLGALALALYEGNPADAARVDEIVARADVLFAQPGGISSGGTTWADLGMIALKQGNLDLAEELFEKGLTIPTTQMHLNRPRFMLGKALVFLARGARAEAADWAAQARVYAEEREMRYLYPFITQIDVMLRVAQHPRVTDETLGYGQSDRGIIQ